MHCELLIFSFFLCRLADFKLQLMYVLFWAFACLSTLYFVVLYGTEFVDKPRLANKREKDVSTWTNKDLVTYGDNMNENNFHRLIKTMCVVTKWNILFAEKIERINIWGLFTKWFPKTAPLPLSTPFFFEGHSTMGTFFLLEGGTYASVLHSFF